MSTASLSRYRPPPLPPSPGASDTLRPRDHGVPPAATHRAPASNAAIAFGVLLLNVGDRLEPLHALLQQTGLYFRRHLIMLLENDSSDCTAERMRQLCASHPATTLCMNVLGLKSRAPTT